MKKKKVFIIQEIIKGGAELPIVFEKETDADHYYVALINEVWEQEFVDIDAAIDYVNNIEHIEHEVYYWCTEIEREKEWDS